MTSCDTLSCKFNMTCKVLKLLWDIFQVNYPVITMVNEVVIVG